MDSAAFYNQLYRGAAQNSTRRYTQEKSLLLIGRVVRRHAVEF